MKRLPILIAAVVVAAGIGATAFYALRDSGGTSAQSSDATQRANDNLSSVGAPTVPPDSNLMTPPVSDPTVTAASDATLEAISTETLATQHLNCGPKADRTGVIARDYGAIRFNCLSMGPYWVVETTGDRQTQKPSVVAILECQRTDSACLAGGEPAAAARWSTLTFPASIGALVFVPPDKARSYVGGLCISLASASLVQAEQCGIGSPVTSPTASTTHAP